MNRGAIIGLVIGILIIGIGIYLLLFHISGSGNVINEQRNLESFTGVKLTVYGDCEIIPSDEFKIEITMDNNLIPYLTTEIHNDILVIRFIRWVGDFTKSLMKVYTPVVDTVIQSGAGNIISTNLITTSQMEIKLSGAGNIRMNLDADVITNVISGTGEIHLDAKSTHIYNKISGAGNLYLIGNTETLSCDITGTGALNAFQLVSTTANVKIDGAGDCQLYVTESLEARIQGAGTIEYKGEPEVKFENSGLGKITRIDGE